MHKVLIIDDDKALTDILGEYLEQQAYEIHVANHPVKGIDYLREHHADILLLDVMMPEMDGFAVLGEIRKFSKVAVIMLTAKGDDYDKILGLELGADDYLPKPFNHRELLARIKALIRRLSPDGVLAQQDIMKAHGVEVNQGTQQVLIEQEKVDMTGTEFALLLCLLKSKGRLISKEQLSETVLGRRLMPFDRSLDMHVSNLRKKLADAGKEELIKTVRGSGYMFISDN